jgi:endonuclease/exonuclease/phosphatase (EEP) superfamily protein YafD
MERVCMEATAIGPARKAIAGRHANHSQRWVGRVRAAALLLVVALGGCATITREQQAFVLDGHGRAIAQPLPCRGLDPIGASNAAEPLPRRVRVVSWNLHKNEDGGWDVDLARFAAEADLMLVQEAALDGALQRVLAAARYDWILGSSFQLFDGRVTGVLTAARVRPATACTQRFFEPLLGLPKATVVARYRVQGSADTLAVANVHSINFSLALGDYRRQLEAIADELGGHRGPIILAGDFNTWSRARLAVVAEVAATLGLEPIVFEKDERARFFGEKVDFLFVRGLDVERAETPVVSSSDHNPVIATLRVRSNQ